MSSGGNLEQKFSSTVESLALDAFKVLFVDDDPTLTTLIGGELEKVNEVQTANDLSSAIKIFSSWHPDLVVVDLRLGTQDGRELLKVIKAEKPETSVILITAFAEKDILIDLFNYQVFRVLEKPFPISILVEYIAELSRMKLNKTAASSALNLAMVNKAAEVKNIGIHINPATRQLEAGGETIQLTPTEFKIFQIFDNSKGRIILREEVESTVWPNTVVSKNTLDTHLWSLRKKVPVLNEKIRIIYGTGFVYV